MTENLQRITEDLEWFCDKFDFRNKDADWKNSKDAIQRGMQKLPEAIPLTRFTKQTANQDLG